LLAALDAVPTYVEAMLALASVRRRFGRLDAALPPLVELDPDGEHAIRARRESRTAADLLRIFSSRKEVA